MKYWLETIAIVAIIVFGVIFLVQSSHIQSTLKPGEEAYGGSDDAATRIIEATGYHPWVSPLWVPPGPEIETLMFSLQAALGAIVIGYFFGYYKGRRDALKSK